MTAHVRDNPLIAFTVAFFRTRIDGVRDRARGERGASAVEWVVIAAICVVNANKTKIQQGTNLPS